MKNFLKLQIITRQDRNNALSKVRDAITGSGGWIMGHHLFIQYFRHAEFRTAGPGH